MYIWPYRFLHTAFMKIQYWLIMLVSLSCTNILLSQKNSSDERLHSNVTQEKINSHFDTVTGFVFNKNTKGPINSATVYINGTTLGTITDEKGYFVIPNVSAPCQLVVSCVGFEPLFVNINSVENQPINLLIHEKATQLSTVTVMGKSNRKEYLVKFRSEFLGTDSWGDKAKILNDSVLNFIPTNDSVVSTSDFAAKSIVPIVVDLPALGYRVFVNLIEFTYHGKSGEIGECHYKGAFYFKAYESITPKQIKNRKEAYYNSAKHFFKSLYEGKLMQNGYLTMRVVKSDSTQLTKQYYDDLGSFCTNRKEETFQIQGLKNKWVQFIYFEDFNGKPVDLNAIQRLDQVKLPDLNAWMVASKQYSKRVMSMVLFLEDQCTVRNNGTNPESNFKFYGAIPEKRGKIAWGL